MKYFTLGKMRQITSKSVKYPACVALMILFPILVISIFTNSHFCVNEHHLQHTITPSMTPRNIPNESIDTKLFSGCTHVYLDMGSNVGVQINKLYEPRCFPGSIFWVPQLLRNTPYVQWGLKQTKKTMLGCIWSKGI